MKYLLLILLCIQPGYTGIVYADTLSVIDDARRTVTLDVPARRVITLSAHSSEILFAAGAGDSLVATIRHSNYPAAALAVPRIGDSSRLDIEKIIDYKPDLVIAWLSGNPRQQVEKLEHFGLKVFYSNPVELEDVASNIRRIGILTGQQHRAEKFSTDFLVRLAELRQAYQSREKLRVFYQLWHEPLITISGKQMISYVIELCGGVNIFADLDSVSASISKEEVIKRNPDVMLTAEDQFGSNRSLSHWNDWKQITAIKYANLYTLPADWIHRQGPRVLDAAEQMCRNMTEARERLAEEKEKAARR